MKCINKIICILITTCLFLTGCGSKYEIPFTADSNISSFSMVNFEKSSEKVEAFSNDLCIAGSNVDSGSLKLNDKGAGGLFDITHHNTIYANNVHEKMHPASLTKIMTAIVALKNGTPDMVLTASPNVYVNDYTAQKMDLREGDQLTLEQALYLLLIYSANDVANLIAEGIGGNIDNFVNMMNEEALLIGATETHFVNPTGLTTEDHYTTAYDLYLMFNEASKFELFNRILNTSEYSTKYYNIAGTEKEIEVVSTNLYIIGKKSSPGGVSVLGGKTGTTNAAGHCLIISSKDTNGGSYISIIMNSPTRDELYDNMNGLLKKVG